jgi:Ca2+-binding RTX toxin-like protein
LHTFIGDNKTVVGAPGGSDLIGVIGDNNSLTGDVGNDTIWSIGNNLTISSLVGNDLNGFIGNNDSIDGGAGNDTIWMIGNHDTVNGNGGNDLIGSIGDSNQITGGTGNDTIFATGNGDTVAGGGGNDQIAIGSGAQTLVDDGTAFNDTVVGFDQTSGDRIHLTSDTAANALAHSHQVNGGLDTLITLSDGSTILLKFVNHIDNSFFS